MAKSFDASEWRHIHALTDSEGGGAFGLPERRQGSVVIGSFNIRKLGAVAKKSPGAWDMFARICARFDLLAIQEVQDDLEGLTHLKTALGETYGMVASDITGSFPGKSPPPERLAFLFRWDVVERIEIASDITFDRAEVFRTLYEHRVPFWESHDNYTSALADWEIKKIENKQAGKKAPAKPTPHLPAFLTFIRQPTCVSFRIPGAAGAPPYEFLAVNAHLLFGKYSDERHMEFLEHFLITRVHILRLRSSFGILWV